LASEVLLKKYMTLLAHDNDGYTVFVPEIGPGGLGAVGFGDNAQEAETHATQSLALYLHENPETPAPRFNSINDVPAAFMKPLEGLEVRTGWLEPAEINSLSLQLDRLFQDTGLSVRKLAEKLETSPSGIARLHDPFYRGHSMSVIHRIGEVLKHRLQVTLEPTKLLEGCTWHFPRAVQP
jgi:antitoxin HicB